MKEDDEYILGTGQNEHDRLRSQHAAWLAPAKRLWSIAGIGAGHRVLDLGCGPGFTSLDLAKVVGDTGHVVGRDVSERFLAQAVQHAKQERANHVHVSHGSAEDHDASLGTFDFVYARWLFCWLEHPAKAIAESMKYLKPGGALVIQDYLDWGAMTLLPPSAEYDRAVDAAMASWHAGQGDINIARRFPQIARELGLTLTHYAPVARIGAVGSEEWHWLGGFVHAYVPTLVDANHIREDEVEAMKRAWAARERDGMGHIYTPTVADAMFKVSA